jgi:hypothetical protein
MQPAPDTGRRLALLIATSVYSDPDLRELRAPGHDATELAEVLRDRQIGGFDVQVLLNTASGEVQEGIEDFCTDRHPDDQLMIYLSCHGVLDSNGRLYYAATNTRRQRLAATAVAAAWLNERLEDCRARRQILVLDCCHSGAFAKGAKGDPELALQHRFEPHGRGRVVLTASRSTEYSFEGGQASGEGVPSVFTHAIVNGLRTGDADRDKDGLITVTDLYQYVYDSVRAAERPQTPELWTYGAEGNLVVAHSIRGAVIEPEPLPEDLRMALESPRRRVRETGVAELADLLDAARPGLALAARQALERIAEDDHPQVAALARSAVDAPAGAAAGQVRRELTDRAQREDRARQEAARRETEERARREAEPLSPGAWQADSPAPRQAHAAPAPAMTAAERIPHQADGVPSGAARLLDAGFVIQAVPFCIIALDILIPRRTFLLWPWWAVFAASILGIAAALGAVRKYAAPASIILWTMTWTTAYSLSVIRTSNSAASVVVAVLSAECIIAAVISFALYTWVLVLLPKNIRNVNPFLVVFMGCFSAALVLAVIAIHTGRAQGGVWNAVGGATLAAALGVLLTLIRAHRPATASN